MDKRVRINLLLILLSVLVFSACASVEPAETVPEIKPDPEWTSEKVIEEAVSCLFPLEGEIDVALAQEILLPLVESGNAEAMYYWGYIYDYLLVDNDGEGEKEALYWYRLAADQGFVKAYMAVAFDEYIEKDEKEAMLAAARQMKFFEMSPEELGPDGCLWMGSYYQDEEDYRTAMDWYEKGAELGDAVSMNAIGIFYVVGYGVDQDFEKAYDWLLCSAEKGNVVAMYNLAYLVDILFENEIAFKIHRGEMLQNMEYWGLKAAEAGISGAMLGMGNLYYLGPEVYHNTRKAADWYERAAECGNGEAMFMLGCVYENGYGGSQSGPNAMEAMKWFVRAYSNGNETAGKWIEHMLSENLGVNAYFENYGNLMLHPS